MSQITLNLTDPDDFDALFQALGGVWDGQLRWIKCPDHNELAALSIGINNETQSTSAAITSCCEKFAKYLLACCKHGRDGGEPPDWYEGKRITLVQKGGPDAEGMFEFRFTDARVMRPFMLSLGDLWDQEIASLKCSIHGSPPAGRDHKKVFTAATQGEPDWGSIRVCCERFAKECLVKLIRTVREDRDDSIFESEIIE